MPWLKMLHVAAIICWCGALLYLPALIAQAGGRAAAGGDDDGPRLAWRLSHRLFTVVATPAALLAIASGSAIILIEQSMGVWLILKLTAVTAMVGMHALAGVLIVRAEMRPTWRVSHYCAVLSLVSFSLILVIAWLVLSKSP